MKLDKKSVAYKAVMNNKYLVFILIFSGPSLSQAGMFTFVIAGLLALLGLGLSVGWNYLYWKKYEYEITGDTFDITSGVLRRDRREIPLHRIQNVDITQNFMLRLVNLAQVNLETAGGGQTEASLKYVSYEEAKRIQKTVRRLKSDKKAEGPETEDDEEEDVLFELQPKELVLLSLTSVSGQAIAGVFFLLSIFGGAAGGVIDSVGIGSQIVVLFLAAVLAFVAWISGAALTVNKYYGFRLVEADETLEYERGLLKRASGSIPRNKIQSVRIEENPVQRLIGYSTVKIDTAGYSPSTAAEMGSEAAVPLAQKSRALELGRKIHYFGELDIEGIPSRASRRYVFRYSMLVGLLTGAGYIADRWFFDVNYWLLLALLPVGFIAAYLKWCNKGYAVDEDYFYTMNGFWNRKTIITPYYRLQTLMNSRTVFQRRLGLSTVLFDTAGSSLLNRNPKAVDIDALEAERLSQAVVDRFQDALGS